VVLIQGRFLENISSKACIDLAHCNIAKIFEKQDPPASPSFSLLAVA
jgi:hypothetical protein